MTKIKIIRFLKISIIWYIICGNIMNGMCCACTINVYVRMTYHVRANFA